MERKLDRADGEFESIIGIIAVKIAENFTDQVFTSGDVKKFWLCEKLGQKFSETCVVDRKSLKKNVFSILSEVCQKIVFRISLNYANGNPRNVCRPRGTDLEPKLPFFISTFAAACSMHQPSTENEVFPCCNFFNFHFLVVIH